MLNRVLILLENELEINNLLKVGQDFKKKYGAHMYGLHIKDIKKYDPTSKKIEELGVDNSANFFIKEWEKAENKEIEVIKNSFKNYFPIENLIIESGIAHEILLKKMLGFDLIITQINDDISSVQKDLLKNHYKPVLLISKDTLLKTEKIIIANNNSEQANKSIFSFFNVFNDVDNFTSVTVNLNDQGENEFSNYMRIAKKTLNSLKVNGETSDIIYEESKKFDILIMGDLKHSFLLENLVGSIGLKLLKKIKIPIYIG